MPVNRNQGRTKVILQFKKTIANRRMVACLQIQEKGCEQESGKSAWTVPLRTSLRRHSRGATGAKEPSLPTPLCPLPRQRPSIHTDTAPSQFQASDRQVWRGTQTSEEGLSPGTVQHVERPALLSLVLIYKVYNKKLSSYINRGLLPTLLKCLALQEPAHTQ